MKRKQRELIKGFVYYIALFLIILCFVWIYTIHRSKGIEQQNNREEIISKETEYKIDTSIYMRENETEDSEIDGSEAKAESGTKVESEGNQSSSSPNSADRKSENKSKTNES